MTQGLDLKDKICLVTGGSRGLGFAMSRALGKAGARIAISARKEDELEQAKIALEAEGIEVRTYRSDLSDVTAAPALVDAIMNDLGPIDVLVNNAGATWGASAATVDWKGWQKVVDVNLNGTWALTQAVAVKCMLPRKTGSIIFISSIVALGGRAQYDVPTVAYNVTKAAQINLTRTLAAEWGRDGIRVNAILPGWFETKMAHATLEQQHEHLAPRLPLGRVGDPDVDMDGPILFLASDASRFVTGHALVVDGGMSAVV